MVNIKVAVRIRPLSQRELLHGEEIVVRKDNKSVLVTNPKIPERQDGDSRQRTRRFAVDFCYDSISPEGCTQEAVYKEIGSEVLHSMFEGYNACVLAYGHSASGKTYTIMGLQNDPGLTPRLCEGLFEKLSEKNPDGRIRVQIIISFLEIYNEKVRDLLGSEEAGGSCGNFSLRVREHPRLGPYVQGLSEHSVADKGKLLQLLTTGTRRRSTAATESNLHSSRSHAVFTIRFRQSDGGNYETEKSSKVHLVDLAGSLQQVSQQETPTNERASASQSKARLQEGANINKSLVTLGNVISALAESHEPGIHPKEHSRSWQPFVPYRDSVLTWLLKDTLGGNSNTIMIATVSPARSCLSETVNTLRYAKRTKKIVNRPIVNEDPKVRTIRELRKEITRLRGLLVFFQSCEGEEEEEEEKLGFSCAESKWPETEGTHVTIKEPDYETQELWEKKSVEEEIRGEGERSSESAASSECESGVGGGRGTPSGGGACEFGDEKKSDVNGSVNDNFSHETQIFSDSLESFSSGSLKSENSCGDEVPGPIAANEDGRGGRETKARSLGQSVTKEFGSCENLSRKHFPGMLHRSRPDLIKGISTRSKESLPLGGSRSCIDVSNLSNSASENSLNSSGSAEVQAPEGRRERNPPGATSGGETRRNEPLPGASKKKEKRLEIVEAVTSRLYVAKKKQEHKAEAPRKENEDDDDDGELEELKLCKRARMKLFDLSRKLAMTRKLKKTVDNDTQTECTTQTLRVKEKCVTTEPSVAESAEGGAGVPAEAPKERTKPYVIMNQVFIPRSANYVVECGKVVRIEAQESATQNPRKGARHKRPDAPPAQAPPRDEDCFSEDSLDLEARSRGSRRAFPQERQEAEGKSGPGSKAAFVWPPNVEYSSDLKSPGTKEELGGVLFNGLPLEVFEGKTEGSEEREWLPVDASTVFSGTRREENVSSENSFTSTEGAELNSLSETSSEDFVFYEGHKDSTAGEKTKGERELYTITENSEHSDPSDPSQASSTRVQKSKGGMTRTPQSPPKKSHELKENTSEGRPPQNSKTLERLPKATNSGERPQGPSSPAEASLSFAEGATTTKGAGPPSEGAEPRSTETHLQSNPQKQYLNLNISSGGKTPPFSVDTHLFAKPPKKDQSTDAMSTSADSITFVFMGPAKPETSVLMEIIKRSLGRSQSEAPGGRRKSRSRGVQCDAGLMRSVSVDTAMMALSRIARNQEPPLEMQRTSSLGGLGTEEAFAGPNKGKLRGRREKSCTCLLETEHSKEENENWRAKHSVGTNTNWEDEVEIRREKNRKSEADKPKKSVSWVEEVQGRVTTKAKEEESEAEAEESEAVGRRVRFLGAEEEGEVVKAKELVHSADNFSAFLREATQLLKTINSRSSKLRAFQDEEESDAESQRKTEENERKTVKKTEALRRSGTEGCLEKEGKEGGWWWKGGAGRVEESHVNLTWPRRRPGAGKPPTGTLGRRPPRPLPPPRLDSPALRSWSQSTRSWNLSNLSLALTNSCLGDACSRSSAHSSYSSYSSPAATPRTELPRLNLDSLSDMESELEERCRLLEVATQKDERRERKREGSGEEVSAESRRVVRRRRRAGKCAGSCSCGEAPPSDPCKHLWSKGCRSSFELDSFGPGSAHCPELCMFCRKKESETYYSALNLNSQCTSGLCRLNYYGYCPCSPVKLSQVVSSPRAYMQHLLALRKQIVSRGESAPPEELQRKPQGRAWRDRARLLDPRGFP